MITVRSMRTVRADLPVRARRSFLNEGGASHGEERA